jgi:hypothetical protein
LSVPDAALLKYVVQPGVLQDKTGAEHGNGVWPSIAGRGRLGRRVQLERNRLATVERGVTCDAPLLRVGMSFDYNAPAELCLSKAGRLYTY